LTRRNQIARDPVYGWLIDAEGLRASEIFARELDHHATIDRLSHCESLSLTRPAAPGANRPKTLRAVISGR
jgi:hypothetical protein